MICKSCNNNINDKDKFCKSCGSEIIVLNLHKYCPECGLSNTDNNQFCSNCGNDLNNTDNTVNNKNEEIHNSQKSYNDNSKKHDNVYANHNKNTSATPKSRNDQYVFDYEEEVDKFLMSNGKYFESIHLNIIREKLLVLDDSKWGLISSIELKDPTTSLIVSILGGGLGIDRFYIGDTGKGIGKLLTCGGAGLWALIDLFLIQKATKEKNMEKVQQFLYL